MNKSCSGGRKSLKGTAYNLAQWCLSRNHDFQGYWAVGQLYRYVQAQGDDQICFDLLRAQPEPSERFYQALAALQFECFQLLLVRQGLSMNWVKALELSYIFGPLSAVELIQSDLQARFLPKFATGVCCQVTLQSDQGRYYLAKRYDWVWPHDPERELRRVKLVAD